jgi:uncharacterized circularly permuted ATP-grasp superfamily protein
LPVDWKAYDPAGNYDELVSSPGHARAAARQLAAYLRSLSDEELEERRTAAELAIVSMGITFTIYDEGQNIDRAWPFDLIPRVIANREWTRIAHGLEQ